MKFIVRQNTERSIVVDAETPEAACEKANTISPDEWGRAESSLEAEEEEEPLDLAQHECEEGAWWREHDAQGIYLCRVCDLCVAAKLAKSPPEILTGYNQDDVDEPIEPS